MRFVSSFVAVLFLGIATGAFGAEAIVAQAAEKADWAAVQKLIEQSADVNAIQPDGMTALHWAVHHENLDSVKRIIAVGGRVKAENRYGATALAIACINGNEAIVSELLRAGADPNAKLRGGETALMTAARTGRVGPVRALLAAKADLTAQDQQGQTALMWASADGHADVIKLLIDSGADVNAGLKSGFTPLMFAAREGQSDAASTLLAAGADVNRAITTDKATGKSPRKGTSALILAVENGHFELAINLVKAGADPNDQRSGYTPLHNLTWVRKPNRGDGDDGQAPPDGSGNLTSLQFVKELVRLGANVNERIEKGGSGRGKLSTTGATPFLMASKTADLSLLKTLVELGANPHLTNQDECTPLMAAAGIGTIAPTEEAGTEPEVLETIEYLLALGADVNAVDQNGETAMHGAAYKSLPLVVERLAQKGARIEIWDRKNKYGWTPLLIAEGFRPGNFKPSADTIDAIHRVMRAAGVTPPPLTPPPDLTKSLKNAN